MKTIKSHANAPFSHGAARFGALPIGHCPHRGTEASSSEIMCNAGSNTTISYESVLIRW